MIRFIAVNVDGYEVEYEYNTVEEIKKEWYSDDCGLPANDADVIEAWIDNKKIEAQEFMDIIYALGIEERNVYYGIKIIIPVSNDTTIKGEIRGISIEALSDSVEGEIRKIASKNGIEGYGEVQLITKKYRNNDMKIIDRKSVIYDTITNKIRK